MKSLAGHTQLRHCIPVGVKALKSPTQAYAEYCLRRQCNSRCLRRRDWLPLHASETFREGLPVVMCLQLLLLALGEKAHQTLVAQGCGWQLAYQKESAPTPQPNSNCRHNTPALTAPTQLFHRMAAVPAMTATCPWPAARNIVAVSIEASEGGLPFLVQAQKAAGQLQVSLSTGSNLQPFMVILHDNQHSLWQARAGGQRFPCRFARIGKVAELPQSPGQFLSYVVGCLVRVQR